jgi:N-acetylglucosaminyldiphosphoundecaprenol N-acetyl-beta-D-mannosaminyltransferase
LSAVDRRAAPRRTPRRERRATERIRVLGADVDLVRPEEVMIHVGRAIDEERQFVVANHNAHSLYLLRKQPDLARFFDRADLIEVDSRPIVAFTRALGSHARGFHRCTYLDWRDHFWSLADRNRWRVYYLGGAPGVAETAASRLRGRYPGAILETRDGYFDAAGAEGDAVVQAIAAFAPHVLFVGMGMPRQELWIADNRDRLPACAIFSVGAAFDYEAGVQKAAPRWTGRVGLEWLFRLAADPRRLFSRYCVEPWRLLGPALSDIAHALKARRTA